MIRRRRGSSADDQKGRGTWGRSPAVAVAAALAATGCDEAAWLTHPAGPFAGATSRLALWFGAIGILVWVVTLSFLAYAVVRGRRRESPAEDDAATRTQARAVLAAAALTVLLLFSLAAADFLVLRGSEDSSADVLVVEVTGHRWWWELVYEPDDPARRFATANELHIPVGRPVLLRLSSADVIHSFWVPRLRGKRDLIPGYRNTLRLEADRPGVYRGACAEFCGLQHGKMKLLVVAEPPETFEAWYASNLAPAAPPADELAESGRRVLTTGRCALCHTVRGTSARGRVGPDLTHLAARRTIAAGVLPNRRGELAGWIVNPQHVKRGVHMPPNPLPGPQLHALLHYLESLE